MPQSGGSRGNRPFPHNPDPTRPSTAVKSVPIPLPLSRPTSSGTSSSNDPSKLVALGAPGNRRSNNSGSGSQPSADNTQQQQQSAPSPASASSAASQLQDLRPAGPAKKAAWGPIPRDPALSQSAGPSSEGSRSEGGAQPGQGGNRRKNQGRGSQGGSDNGAHMASEPSHPGGEGPTSRGAEAQGHGSLQITRSASGDSREQSTTQPSSQSPKPSGNRQRWGNRAQRDSDRGGGGGPPSRGRPPRGGNEGSDAGTPRQGSMQDGSNNLFSPVKSYADEAREWRSKESGPRERQQPPRRRSDQPFGAQEPPSFRSSNGPEAHRLDADAASEASHDGSASQHSQQGSMDGQGPFRSNKSRNNRRGSREPPAAARLSEQPQSDPGAGPSAPAAGVQPGPTQPAANELHDAGRDSSGKDGWNISSPEAARMQASGSYADEWAEVEKTRTPSPAPVPVVNAWAKPLISAPAARRPPPGMSQPGTEPSSAAGSQAHDSGIPAQQAPSRASRDDSPAPDPAQASEAPVVISNQAIATSFSHQQPQQSPDEQHSIMDNPEEGQEVRGQQAALASDQPGMPSPANTLGRSQHTQPPTYDMMGGVMPGSPHRHTRTSAPYPAGYGPRGYNPAMTSIPPAGPPGMPPPGMPPPGMYSSGPGQLHSSQPMHGPQSLSQPMGGPSIASQPLQPYSDTRGYMNPSSRPQMQQVFPSHTAYHPTSSPLPPYFPPGQPGGPQAQGSQGSQPLDRLGSAASNAPLQGSQPSSSHSTNEQGMIRRAVPHAAGLPSVPRPPAFHPGMPPIYYPVQPLTNAPPGSAEFSPPMPAASRSAAAQSHLPREHSPAANGIPRAQESEGADAASTPTFGTFSSQPLSPSLLAQHEMTEQTRGQTSIPVVNIAAQPVPPAAAEHDEGPKLGKPRPKATGAADARIQAAIKAKKEAKAAAALASPQKTQPQGSPTPEVVSEPLAAARQNAGGPPNMHMPAQGPSGTAPGQNGAGPLAPTTSTNIPSRLDAQPNGAISQTEGGVPFSSMDAGRPLHSHMEHGPNTFRMVNGHADGAAASRPAAAKANGIQVDKENAPPARKPATIVDLSKRGRSWAGIVGRISAEELKKAAAAAAAAEAPIPDMLPVDERRVPKSKKQRDRSREQPEDAAGQLRLGQSAATLVDPLAPPTQAYPGAVPMPWGQQPMQQPNAGFYPGIPPPLRQTQHEAYAHLHTPARPASPAQPEVPASFQFIVGSGSQEADMPIRTLEADEEVEHQQAPALTSAPDPHKYSVLPGFVATVPAEEVVEDKVEELILAPLDPAVQRAVEELCRAVEPQSLAKSGQRPMPRGLQNTGNLCFMNSIMQALMSSGSFCGLMGKLQTAEPALSQARLTTLTALASFSQKFSPAEPTRVPGVAANTAAANQAAGDAAPAAAPSAEEDPASEDPSGDKAEEGKLAAPAGNAWADGKPAESKPQPGPSKAVGAWSHGPPKPESKPGPSQLGGKELLPDMLFPIVASFNPQITQRNAGKKENLADKVRRGEQRTAAASGLSQQQDAQEFLTYLLDQAHEELKRLPKLYPDVSAASDGQPGGATFDDSWEVVAKKNKTAITRGQENVQGGNTAASAIFGGAVRSEIKAKSQQAKPSANVEAFTLLTLNISEPRVKDLESAITAFTAPETLDDYKLQDKGPPVTAEKTVRLYRLPCILVCHLARFTFGGLGTDKLHKQVHFDSSLRLRPQWMDPACPQNRTGATYELIAAVSHLGVSGTSGHYTADVRQSNGQWLRCDDASIYRIGWDKVKDQPAYLLFYQLKDPAPSSSGSA